MYISGKGRTLHLRLLAQMGRMRAVGIAEKSLKGAAKWMKWIGLRKWKDRDASEKQNKRYDTF